jgi:DNA repair photolyase
MRQRCCGRELGHPRWKREFIALGTACDPYDPAERQHLLTRRILQALRDFASPVGITTKSNLVTRDIDVIRELSEVAAVSVNFSISTLEEETWRRIEPGTPKPIKRLKAMEQLPGRAYARGSFWPRSCRASPTARKT